MTMGLFAEHSAQRVRRSACFARDVLALLDDDEDASMFGQRMAADPKTHPSTWIAEDLQSAGFLATVTRKQLAMHLTRHRKGDCSCG